MKTIALLVLCSSHLLCTCSATEEYVPEDAKNDVRHYQEQYAEYLQKMTFGSLIDVDTIGGPPLDGGRKDPRFPQFKKISDDLMAQVGKVYAAELEARYLSPPRNSSMYPKVPESTSATYFDIFDYAVHKVAMLLIDCGRTRTEYFKRIGRRAYELARAQCLEYDPSHDSEDLRGMRHALDQLLEQLQSLGLVKGHGSVWPKGTYKRWEEEGMATFELWLDEPIAWGSSVRIHEEEGIASTLMARIVEQHFSAYLVEASMDKFSPKDQKDNSRVSIKWKLESLM
uniref:Uncharacterized protein n=1 Tax=Pyramimonas obovata TaxID=1411642 RepID=A0A7S0RLJ9_9CHLO|mmetsp:Transcript_37200/g.80986  ORF Transcript_37200/g.80986 Transcript_37200/m.80986 type:complete len:284 (+) Transcript_37200:160-1011(+)